MRTGLTQLEIFMSGKDKWNEYIDKHPDANIDFSYIDFSGRRKEGEPFDFSGYKFPKKGDVNFCHAKFGEENVDFGGVEFGEGYVYFHHANFGEGNVVFREVKFGKGDVDFCHANFGEGNVVFRKAEFGEGDVVFSHAKFGEGDVYFSHAKFGEGDVYFEGVEFGEGNVNFGGVEFGKGNVDFCHANFGEGNVVFRKAEFGEGDVVFSHAKFGEGDVYFSYAKFGEGSVYFGEVEFGEGKVDFDSCEFKGNISFRALQDVKKLSSFSLRNSIFNKSLDMSDNSFNCIPDLTNTKLTNQVSLDRVKILDKDPNGKDKGERLCRLKEISEDNKNHQQALDFHVMEMRANRHKLHKWDRRFDCLFDTIATYGNSITSPMIYLLCTTLSFTYIYASMSIVEHAPAHSWYDWIDRFLIGFLYSLSQALPFVSAGRNSANDSLNQLFPCETVPDGVYLFSLLQGVLSFVLLFLIGLGFRNRFRL